jgi:predicted MFS family arabinose efflux permease
MGRTRVAVAVVFFANGAGMASWVPHIPMAQATLGLGPSVLGLALLAMGVGALVGIPLSGRASARLGSRTVVRVSALLFSPRCRCSWRRACAPGRVVRARRGERRARRR